MTNRFSHRHTLGSIAGVIVLSLCAAACSSKSASVPPPAQALWGDMKPVVSVRELMRDMIDPIADNIFDSVSVVIDRKGTVEHSPKTDEDWEKIRIGAVTLAEGSYLLKVPRPFTPPGDENNSAGPDAPELSPAQITAKLTKDPVEWNARIEALRNVGLEVLEIVKRKDASELWDASDNLDAACENCHKSYWYPGENDQFYRRINSRLRDRFAEAPRSTKP